MSPNIERQMIPCPVCRDVVRTKQSIEQTGDFTLYCERCDLILHDALLSKRSNTRLS